MSRVVHFELPAEDPERAATFYRAAFNWKIEKWDGSEDYWLITTGDESEKGINGGLMRVQDGFDRVTNIIDVTNLDESIAKVEAAGGVIVMPKHAISGIGWFSYAKDTEGLVFGMMQSDASVA